MTKWITHWTVAFVTAVSMIVINTTTGMATISSNSSTQAI